MELNSKLYEKLRAVLVEAKKILCSPDSGGLTPRGAALKYNIEWVQEQLYCLSTEDAKPKDGSVHERTYLYCHNCSFQGYSISQDTGKVTYCCPNCRAVLHTMPIEQCTVCNSNNKHKGPKQRVFVGMMRPTFEEALTKVAGFTCNCGAGLVFSYSYSLDNERNDRALDRAKVREHWQLGHFDWPVYKEV